MLKILPIILFRTAHGPVQSPLLQMPGYVAMLNMTKLFSSQYENNGLIHCTTTHVQLARLELITNFIDFAEVITIYDFMPVGYNHKSGHSSKRRSRIPPKTNFMRPASTDTTSTSWNFSTSPSSKKGNCTHTHGASVFATSSVKDLSYYEQLLTILPTRMTRSIAMNDETPITSDKFPSHSGYEGPHYEIQFFPSDAADSKFVSISINVANSYLRTIARSRVRGRLTVEIPAMEINVTISYASQTTASESIEIKSVMTVTKKTEIDCESSCLWTAEVASFPQIVSHAQLKLPQSESIIIIKVKMRVLQD